MIPRPVLGLTALCAGLLACTSVDPPHAKPPTRTPAPSAKPAPSAQAFGESGVEYVFTDPDRRKKLESAFPAIDALADAEVRNAKLPGLVIGVVIDGELAYAKGFGFADIEKKTKPDADTVYQIASNTKSFTALAVLALRDESALTLDDPLTRLLPEAIRLVYPTRDAPPITLRQLLTHTSGLPRIGAFESARMDHPYTEPEIIRSLSGIALESPPGTAYSYSNLGYTLLGLAVRRGAHMALPAFVKKRLLDPLGMTSSSYGIESVPVARLAPPYKRTPSGAFEITPVWRPGARAGSGGLCMSLRDMARYLAFQLSAYPPRNEPDTGPVRRSSVRESHFNVLKGDGISAENYGYGWAVEESCDFDHLVWHSGGSEGYSAWWGFLPESGVGVMVSTNVLGGGGGLAKRAILALKKSGGLEKRVPRMKKLSPALEAVMPQFLAVLNTWSEKGYKAMLTKPRFVPIEEEKKELAGYRATHGACKGYVPIEISSPAVARFAMQCERGSLEMEITLNWSDGLIRGFAGTSRGISETAELTRVAKRIAGLIGKWDEGVYKKHLAPKAQKPLVETHAFFLQKRVTHGSCAVKAFSRWANQPQFVLDCERGGELKLTLEVDETAKDVVKSYAITGESSRACPAQ